MAYGSFDFLLIVNGDFLRVWCVLFLISKLHLLFKRYYVSWIILLHSGFSPNKFSPQRFQILGLRFSEFFHFFCELSFKLDDHAIQKEFPI